MSLALSLAIEGSYFPSKSSNKPIERYQPGIKQQTDSLLVNIYELKVESKTEKK